MSPSTYLNTLKKNVAKYVSEYVKIKCQIRKSKIRPKNTSHLSRMLQRRLWNISIESPWNTIELYWRSAVTDEAFSLEKKEGGKEGKERNQGDCARCVSSVTWSWWYLARRFLVGNIFKIGSTPQHMTHINIGIQGRNCQRFPCASFHGRGGGDRYPFWRKARGIRVPSSLIFYIQGSFWYFSREVGWPGPWPVACACAFFSSLASPGWWFWKWLLLLRLRQAAR